MKIKLYMAQTANGKIARKNGDEDFLSPRNWKEFRELAEKTGVFVVGRKTYEAVQKWEEKGFKDIEAHRVVLTRNQELELEKGFRKASSPEEAVELAEQKGEGLLVTGGASVNTSFMKKGLIDEIILNIEPHVLGEGLDLFAEESFEHDLELEEVRELEEGIVQLHYKI